MKIPKTLKIGGHVIKVITDKTNDSNFAGEFNVADNTIYINKNLNRSQAESTLIHEALHAMNATMSASPDGHKFLDSLSEQIYAFLKINKLIK